MAGIKISIGLSSRKLMSGLKGVMRRLRKLPMAMGRIGMRMGRSLATGMKRAVIGGVAAVGGLIAKSLGEAGKFEKYEFQFQALLGTVDKAKKRIEDMKKLDLEVDAELGDLMDASRVLTVFTNNMHAGTDAVRMMADAAAVTPNNIKDVAFWYGRAYSMINSGRPFGEASMRLQEMGLMSGEARNEIEKLSEGSGRMTNIEKILEVVNREFLKFEGAAARNATTWLGMMSIFRSTVSQGFAAVGESIMPLAKVWLTELIDKITELRDDGTLAGWGERISQELEKARAFVEKLTPELKHLAELMKSTFKKGELDPELAASIETGVRDGLNRALEILEGFVPQFAKIGLQIGKEMAKGLHTAIGEHLPSWFAPGGRWSFLPSKAKLKDKKEVDDAVSKVRAEQRTKMETAPRGVGQSFQAMGGMAAEVNAAARVRAEQRERRRLQEVQKVQEVNPIDAQG